MIFGLPLAVAATVYALVRGASPCVTWAAFTIVSGELLWVVAQTTNAGIAPMIGAVVAVAAMAAIGIKRTMKQTANTEQPPSPTSADQSGG